MKNYQVQAEAAAKMTADALSHYFKVRRLPFGRGGEKLYTVATGGFETGAWTKAQVLDQLEEFWAEEDSDEDS